MKINDLYKSTRIDDFDPVKCADCNLQFDIAEHDRNIGIKNRGIEHNERLVHNDCTRAFHHVLPRKELTDARHILPCGEEGVIVRREYSKGYDAGKSSEEITDMIKEKLLRLRNIFERCIKCGLPFGVTRPNGERHVHANCDHSLLRVLAGRELRLEIVRREYSEYFFGSSEELPQSKL